MRGLGYSRYQNMSVAKPVSNVEELTSNLH